MDETPARHDPFLEAAWHVRQRYWQRKLGRLRLGAEPLEDQLAKYFRVTWVLTITADVVALIIVCLFAAFRRVDIGVIFASILFFPVVGLAWFDWWVLRGRAMRYQRELAEYERRQPTPGRT
jgi:hypothetical protein